MINAFLLLLAAPKSNKCTSDFSSATRLISILSAVLRHVVRIKGLSLKQRGGQSSSRWNDVSLQDGLSTQHSESRTCSLGAKVSKVTQRRRADPKRWFESNERKVGKRQTRLSERWSDGRVRCEHAC